MTHSEAPAITARVIVAARMLPCPNCGAVCREYSEHEAQTILDRDAEMRTTEAGRFLADKLFAIPVMCRSCVTSMQFADATERTRIRLALLTRRTYATGLLPRHGRACTFEESRADFEARNPGPWGKARRVPLEKGLWLCGTPSTGKTFMSLCIANNYLEQRRSVAMLRGIDLNEMARPWEMIDALKPYEKANLLILDDIDKPRWTPRGLDALYHIVEARHGRGDKRLIVTANATRGEVEAMWNKIRADNPSMARAIVERMLPMEGFKFTGNSLRDVAADERYADDE